MAKKQGLGRGLEALFENNAIDEASVGETANTIRLSDIEPDKKQPRKTFDEAKLEGLTASIKQHGVIQPLIVRKIDDGRFCIIAGERRWRAARRAGLKEIPAIVRDYNDKQIREISLIENLQREDLNPIEEALGYKSLIEEFDLKQEDVANIIGKSRPTVTNALRLLTLPDEVIDAVKFGRLSQGHARALLAAETSKQQIELAKKAEKNGLTVREIENYLKRTKQGERQSATVRTDENITALEKQIEESLGRKVRIICRNGKGKVEIGFYSNDDLNQLADYLRQDTI